MDERRRSGADEATNAAATSEAAGSTNEGWIEWGGGYRPVMADTQVEVRLHNGEQYKDTAEEIRWSTRNERDVAAYRVVSA